MPNFFKNKRKYKKYKGNRSKNLSFLFAFVFLIIFCLLIINFADLFSSLITRKGSLFSVNKIETASYSIYGVSVKDFATQEEAENYVSSVKDRGGAGYIYQNGEYFVLVQAYQSLNEAIEIKDNLVNLGYKARIINIKVGAINKVYKGSNQQLLTDSLLCFRTCYNTLYDEGLNFDKNLSNKNQTNSVIAKILTLLLNQINNLETLKTKTDIEIKNIIIPHLKTSKELLENLLYSNKEKLEYSSQLKVVAIKIVLENTALAKLINEM